MRYLFIPILFFVSLSAFGQSNLTEQAAKDVVAVFFEGFHKADTLLMRSVMHPDMQMHSTFISKKSGPKVSSGSVVGLLKAIADRPKDQIWEEKLTAYKIEIDHSLANVWTPYTFSVNGVLSHCGANNFVLAATQKGWQILYLIDSRKRTGCDE